MSDEQKNKIELDLLKDPVTKLLFVKYGSNGYFIFLLMQFVPLYCASIYEGGFWVIEIARELNVPSVPMVVDIGIITGLIYAVFLGILINDMFKNLNKHIEKLWKNKIYLNDDIKIYNNHLKKYESIANSKHLYILGIIFFLIFYIYEYYIEDDIVDVIFTSNSPYFPLTKQVLTLDTLITSFIFGIFLWKLFTIIRLLRSLFDNKELILKGLNPWNTFLLHPIGDIIYDMVRVILLFTYTPLSSIVFAFYWQPDVSKMFLYRGISTSVLYIILSLIILTYPLLPLHTLLKEQKWKLLSTYREKNRELSLKMYKDKLDMFEMPIRSHNINEYYYNKNLISDINSMQEWPFNTAFLNEIFISLLFPLSLNVVRVIIQTLLIK